MIKLYLLCLVLTAASTAALGQGVKGKPADVVIIETKLQAIIGGVRDGNLIDAQTAAPSLKGNVLFRHYGPPGNALTDFIVTAIDEPAMPCEDFYGYAVKESVGSGVAFSSNLTWNPQPRAAAAISASSRAYRNIVRSYLQKNGISNPTVKIQEAYRVDLEGDGIDEVLIRAENYSNFGPGTKKGEYSFVLLRKMVGKTVRNILITGEFFPKAVQFGAPNKLEISGIVDLDGNGTMEIVIYGEYYEGVWTEAYGLENGKPKIVLQAGCGV